MSKQSWGVRSSVAKGLAGRVAVGVVAVASLSMLLAACGGSNSASSSGSSSSQGTPVRGGTLKLVGNGDVDSIDTTPAYYAPSYTLERAFTRQLYTYASAPNFAGQVNPVPDLATAMPTITANNTVYTIHLRPDARWDTTPPRPVTAQDEVLGMKRVCNPASPTGAPGYFEATIAGMKAYCDAFLALKPADAASIKTFIDTHDISGVKALDPATVQFTLTRPASDFLNILALPFSSPVPVEYLNYLPGSPDQATHTVSDGPYAITSYVASKSISLARNPAWKASSDPIRKAYVDNIQITEGIPSATSAQQQIEAGTQDMDWDQNVPTADLAALSARRDPNLVIGPYGDNFIFINPLITINEQSPSNGGALGKLAVRQALEYAFNKYADAQVYGGPAVAKPLDQTVPPGSVGNISGYDPYPTPGGRGDPAKAKALLKQAGYAPGQITLKLVYRTNTVHPQIAQTDQAALQAAGFKVQLIPVNPANTMYTKYLENPTASQAGSWDIAEPGWIPDWLGNNGRSIIEPLFDGRTYGPNTQDWGDYNNPMANADIDKALSAPSIRQATQAWQAAARQVMADAAVVPVGAQKQAIYHSSRTHNCVFLSFTQNCDITNVWLSGH